jgi:zinc protease
LPSTVEPITRADLQKFHDEWWKPGSSALIFVGDVTLAEATDLAKKNFGSWAGAAAPSVPIPPPQPAAAGKLYLVDRQDAAQTVVSQYLPAPPRQSPDYYSLHLADSVWGGGGFGTRLNLNLREDKGYSYGVSSNIAHLRSGGLWYAGGGVQTNKTKESLVEFDKELKAIAGAKPITEAEFEDAKVKRIRSYAQQFESNQRIAQQVADLWAFGLPMEELQREVDETRKVTLEAARAAASSYAKPAAAAVLLVGDRSKIEAGVRETNLGEIVLLDVEGKPVSAVTSR